MSQSMSAIFLRKLRMARKALAVARKQGNPSEIAQAVARVDELRSRWEINQCMFINTRQPL